MKKQKTSAEKCACRKRSRLAPLLAGTLATVMLPLAAHATQNSLPGMGVQPAEYFYTGKPYDSDTESYTFKYRNYDPELNRWITMDPSGFPDGANAFAYINNHVISSIDPDGLAEVTFTGHMTFDVPGTSERLDASAPGKYSYTFTGDGKHFATQTTSWTGAMTGVQSYTYADGRSYAFSKGDVKAISMTPLTRMAADGIHTEYQDRVTFEAYFTWTVVTLDEQGGHILSSAQLLVMNATIETGKWYE